MRIRCSVRVGPQTSHTYDSASEHRGLVTGEDVGVSSAPGGCSPLSMTRGKKLSTVLLT